MCTIRRIISNQEKILAWLGMIIIKVVKKKNKNQKFVFETNYAFTKNGIVFIVVDGAKEVIPTPSGYYKPETLTWLDNQLKKYDNKKVVIF